MQIKRSDFPPDFIFGAATSAYQIEGSKFGGCGDSHWDYFAAMGHTAGWHDGAIACDHYHRWPEDLDLIADCGMSAYRFSTSWARVLPEGRGVVNAEGLDFYDRLVDGILARGLQPHLTLYHWDLPQALARRGGWQNPDIAHWFADFSQVVLARLGDRLASTATINEPWCVAWLSHFLGHHAPGLHDIAAAGKAMHHVLAAHGKAVEALRAQGVGNLGIVLNMEAAQAANESEADQRAANMHDGIYNRWFAQALFTGSYPADILAHLEPYLPHGWQVDMAEINQKIDWLGLNYYTRALVQDDGTDAFPFGRMIAGPLEKTSMDWEIYPEGLSGFLQRLHSKYTGDLPLYVTENGMASNDVLANGAVADDQRCAYFDRHLQAVQQAIAAGAPVKGYFAWSLLDNYEWAFGYDQRFGLVHVDFDSQKRMPKASYYQFQKMLGQV